MEFNAIISLVIFLEHFADLSKVNLYSKFEIKTYLLNKKHNWALVCHPASYLFHKSASSNHGIFLGGGKGGGGLRGAPIIN